MASDKSIVEFIADQIQEAGDISYRKMFGEFALYCDGKVVAFVCDNLLFIKPTEGGRTYIGDVVEAPIFPGSKNYFLIEDKVEDHDWLTQLVRITAREVPPPKPKKSKKQK